MKKHVDVYSPIIPTLAIIIPAYNVEMYIADTLDTIMNQSVQPDEVIIINDGSTDKTSNIIKNHLMYKKINFIEIQNGGQGLARNLGLSKAKSDYIYFFDSDDLLDNNFVKIIKQKIVNFNFPDLLMFSGESFRDDLYSNNTFNPNYIRPFEGSYIFQEDFLKAMIQFPDLSCSPCLYVSKRKLWINDKIKFNPFYHEDEEVFYPLIFSASSYLISKEKLFFRRIRPNSTMTKAKTIKHKLGLKAVLISLLNLLEANKANNLKTILIRRRIAKFVIAYIHISKQINSRTNYKLILKSIVKSRQITLPLRVIKTMVKKHA